MRIRTVISRNAEDFDEKVNTSIEEGWRIARRDVDLDPPTFYAELVKVDDEPAPDPLEALRVVRDFCEEMPTDKCLGKCPLSHWCAMYCPEEGMSPADWMIPEEVAR